MRSAACSGAAFETRRRSPASVACVVSGAMSAVAEHVLVTDALACCAGLQGGRYVQWSEEARDGLGGRYSLAASGIPAPQRQLLGRTAELGALLKRVDRLTGELEALQPPSVVHEALVAAARRELSSYYRLVAILEAQAAAASGGGGGAPADGALTLRRLQVWLSEPLGRLRVLAGCLEAAASMRGGQALNALHALSKHGDPLVRKVVAPLLEAACVPYFKQISLWVLSGTLDGGGATEFLVAREPLAPPHCDDPAATWRSGYRRNAAMQPRFISDQLAADILTTGKTIAFLREWCGDTRWAAAIGGAARDLAAASGNYRQLRCVLRQSLTGVGWEAGRAVHAPAALAVGSALPEAGAKPAAACLALFPAWPCCHAMSFQIWCQTR